VQRGLSATADLLVLHVPHTCKCIACRQWVDRQMYC